MKFACCSITSGTTSDIISCSKCKCNYHLLCLYPCDKKGNELKKKSWVCPTCQVTQPKQQKTDNTPVRGGGSNTAGNENVTVKRGGVSRLYGSPVEQDSTLFTLEQVRALISDEFSNLKINLEASLTNEIKSLRDDIHSFKESLAFFNSKYDDINNRINSLEEKIKTLKGCDGNLEMLDNFVKVNNQREQWMRKSNIEIYGIPERKNENLFELLNSIAKRCEIQLNPSTDIDFITRVKPKENDASNTKPIVVRFLARWKKDDFLAHFRKLKLKCSDIGFTSNNNNVYFNDHLTSANKSLLYQAKKIANDKKYKFIWVRNCTIMVRKSENNSVIHILSQNDLKKIV